MDSLQPPFSAIKRSMADEIAWCAANSTGCIVYSPMQAGLLSGAFSAQRVASLHHDDWRTRDAEFQGERLQRNLALAGSLRPIADAHGTTVAAVAVAWVLAWPGITGAIVGATRHGPGRRLVARRKRRALARPSWNRSLGPLSPRERARGLPARPAKETGSG